MQRLVFEVGGHLVRLSANICQLHRPNTIPIFCAAVCRDYRLRTFREHDLNFYLAFARSLMTSDAMIRPTTDGTKALEPGMSRRGNGSDCRRPRCCVLALGFGTDRHGHGLRGDQPGAEVPLSRAGRSMAVWSYGVYGAWAGLPEHGTDLRAVCGTGFFGDGQLTVKIPK